MVKPTFVVVHFTIGWQVPPQFHLLWNRGSLWFTHLVMNILFHFSPSFPCPAGTTGKCELCCHRRTWGGRQVQATGAAPPLPPGGRRKRLRLLVREGESCWVGYGWHVGSVCNWERLTTVFSKTNDIPPNGFQLFHSLQLTAAFLQPTTHNNFYRTHSSNKHALIV